jgi:N6-adenosine-specific RNA methylase IME4
MCDSLLNVNTSSRKADTITTYNRLEVVVARSFRPTWALWGHQGSLMADVKEEVSEVAQESR